MSRTDLPLGQRLAVPGVTALVAFLGYTSQLLFSHVEPGPPPRKEIYIFNILVASLLICYWRTCLTDPGRIPKDWHGDHAAGESRETAYNAAVQSNRWCKKCEAYKPPRAHHCKTCKRCIMKMDHHCIWTANCVSHITIPHFVRFLFYAVVSMIYLEYFLYVRLTMLWDKRHLPSYLGPSIIQLAHLFVLCVTNSLVLFALLLLLGRTIWCLTVNTWTIEGWEIERHEALLRRAHALGGYLEGPDNTKVRIEEHEFPWDVGIWTNICQGMGSRNPLNWFWPFSASPSIGSGLSFEHNKIDDPSKPWPPPDPDRLFRADRSRLVGDGFTHSLDVNEFRRRQAADRARHTDANGDYVVRRRPFHERLENATRKAGHEYYSEHEHDVETDDGVEEVNETTVLPRHRSDEGEEAWRNKEGERLADFGVDEAAEFYDEDELPLAVLLRQRQKGTR